MSQARLRYVTGCPTGKRSYESKAIAKTAKRQLVGHGVTGARGMNAYHCDQCDLYHLGHLHAATRKGITYG